MNSPIIYIVLNGGLKMSAGKAAAQTAHALASLHNYRGISGFSEQKKRTIIVLKAQDQQQMDNLEDYLLQLDIPAMSYIDEGANEVLPYSVTALAIGPIDKYDQEKRDILKDFPLYDNDIENKRLKKIIQLYWICLVGIMVVGTVIRMII